MIFAAGCARRTGRDVSGIGYDMGFGCFTLAVVLAVVMGGVYARYSLNQAVGKGFEHERLAVPSLVARAHQVPGADD